MTLVFTNTSIVVLSQLICAGGCTWSWTWISLHPLTLCLLSQLTDNKHSLKYLRYPLCYSKYLSPSQYLGTLVFSGGLYFKTSAD